MMENITNKEKISKIKKQRGQESLFEWCVKNNKKDILEQWDCKKNYPLTIKSISKAARKKVWWRCSEGHSWMTETYHRTISGTGCPYCKHKKVIIGKTNLKTVNYELFKEIHPTKNKNINLTMIAPYSNKKIWWLGKCGHEWKATVSSRNREKTNCPYCSKEMKTSFNEQAIFFYIKKYYKDATNGNREVLNKKELDIYIPTINTAIEYDGKRWHQDLQRDIEKIKECNEKGIRLIRIREKGCPKIPNNMCEVINAYSIESTIVKLLNLLNIKGCSINLEEDNTKIYSNYIEKNKDNSFIKKYPELKEIWHPIKNKNLNPEMFAKHSEKKVWWKGKCGHEWKEKVVNMTRRKKCPYCSNKKVLKGFNDLETKKPLIAKEWNYDKNKNICSGPDNVVYGSGKKVWWRCSSCGNDYKLVIAKKSRVGACPKCSKNSRKKIINIDTGEVCESLTYAGEKYNVNLSNLSQCCKGIRKSCGGYHWKYYD